MRARRAVLVPRPEPGLSETVTAVAAQGWQPVKCPVLMVHPASPMPMQECKALAVTSVQALPFLACQPKDRLLLTVGEKTAHRARQAGFVNVCAAEGNATALEALCRNKKLAGSGLLFACGRGPDGRAYGRDLADSLGAQWVEAYRVERSACLSSHAVAALEADQVEAVLFYSREMVLAFMALCSPALRKHLPACRALCLSASIADQAVSCATWREVTASAPLKALGQYSSD